MPSPREKTYTIENIYALPDGQRAELIDGRIYMMSLPSPFHQEIIMELSATIRQHIKENNGHCKVYPAPLAVRLHADTKTWVEPDISVMKEPDQRRSIFVGAYWCIILAVYIGVSLYMENWHRSWIIWPVAGVSFAAFYTILGAFMRRKR